MIRRYLLRPAALISIVFIGCLGFGFLALTNDASAKSIISEACTFAPDSETCKSDSANAVENPLTGTSGTLYKVSQVIAIIAGIAAVIVIIISGIRYIISGGDSQKVSSAKSTLIGAVVGLVVIVLAQTIITFVVKRL